MAERDLTFSDLLKGINSENLKIDNPIAVPDNQFHVLLDMVIERSSLEKIGQREKFYFDEEKPILDITWLKIVRLPVSPSNVSDYNMFDRWQGVLSSMHEWGYRFYFLLQRKDGQTSLYLGVRSQNEYFDANDALEQVEEATSGSMPGIELKKLSDRERAILKVNLDQCNSIGAVTGLPSFFEENKPGVLQTLDPLAFGIRGKDGVERDYSLLIIGDPISDSDTTDIMNRMRTLGSEIHTYVERSVNEGSSKSESKQKGLGAAAGTIMGGIGSNVSQLASGIAKVALPIAGPIIGLAFSAVGGIMAGTSKSISESTSLSVTSSYLDKFAQYAEQLTDIHVERMKEGRNLGFWNVGIYVLGKDRKDVNTVNGMLRSIYSGRNTYVEPIRLHVLKRNSGAMEIVKDYFDLIPTLNTEVEGMTEDTVWHIFGKNYQYLSTPMNTKELALATSLPQNDVPGLRFVKSAVRFANNPPVINGEAITLGNIVNMGVEQNAPYRINHNDLVRHALVVGSTGSGKSCSCKRIISEVLEKDIPTLIIEPAKDDWVRWALKMNKILPEKNRFRIYMPGLDEFEGEKLCQLKLSPFQPAAVAGAKVDMTSRCENLISLINASLPSEDVLPVLIDETIYSLYAAAYKDSFTSGTLMDQQGIYPVLASLSAMSNRIMQKKGYEEKVRANLSTCLETRFNYLTRGTRGKLLNVAKSTDYSELFDHPTIINISGISAPKDKALIMSVLLLSLYEYRKSKYANDFEYRKLAQENKLLHLTLIEEAHNVLLKPEGGSSSNPQKVVADLFTNMLSEIRSYGEGLMIVDQYPTRLIPDAIKNTNYKIIHRLASPDDAQVMAAAAALRDEQKALIPALSPGNAIIFGDRDDAAAWIHMNMTRF
ncbi:MAG: ATP-binding protein [Clostridia bacterium]|nr:ATP-binding protein [Clostridia bacterium]